MLKLSRCREILKNAAAHCARLCFRRPNFFHVIRDIEEHLEKNHEQDFQNVITGNDVRNTHLIPAISIHQSVFLRDPEPLQHFMLEISEKEIYFSTPV